VTLAIVAIVAALFMQTRQGPAGAPARAGGGPAPTLHFTGKISQHVQGGGLIVSCTDWKPYLNQGHRREELVGVFFVVGLPTERSLPNGSPVEFDGRSEGLYQHRTVLGVKNTVSTIRYVEPGPAH
jgi:hypothetical protein